MKWAAAFAVVVVLLCAACGGNEKTYSVQKTRSCLRAKHVRTSDDVDFIASTATGGAFKATMPPNYVTVVFGATEDDAKQIELGYKRAAFANVKKVLADLLRRDHNAVMLWHRHPEDSDLELITGCLS